MKKNLQVNLVSIADRHLLKIYDNIKKYIESNRIS